MLDEDTRKAIYKLHQHGMSITQIAKSMGYCENTDSVRIIP